MPTWSRHCTFPRRCLQRPGHGQPLTFAAFTQFVIDKEHQWLKDVKAKPSISQVSTSFTDASSSSANTSNSSSSNSKLLASSYNKETGEPIHRFIHSIDVGVLYRNVGQLEEEETKDFLVSPRNGSRIMTRRKCPRSSRT